MPEQDSTQLGGEVFTAASGLQSHPSVKVWRTGDARVVALIGTTSLSMGVDDWLTVIGLVSDVVLGSVTA